MLLVGSPTRPAQVTAARQQYAQWDNAVSSAGVAGVMSRVVPNTERPSSAVQIASSHSNYVSMDWSLVFWTAVVRVSANRWACCWQSWRHTLSCSPEAQLPPGLRIPHTLAGMRVWTARWMHRRTASCLGSPG